MVGLERTVVPLIGKREFGLASKTAIVSFIVSFGVTKALLNLVAARLSERVGRKPILVAGWLVGLPVPFMIMWAPSWGWIDAANVLLGANQAFAWSMTVIMKVDLVGPARRGLALGLNSFAGYLVCGGVGGGPPDISRASIPFGPSRSTTGASWRSSGFCSRRCSSVRRRNVAMEVSPDGPDGSTRGARSLVSRGLRAHDLARPESLGRLPGGAASTT